MRLLCSILLISGCFAELLKLAPIHYGVSPLCESHPDGFYPTNVPCSSEMLICESGRLEELVQCPFSLVFDEQNHRCDFPQNVVSCGMRSADTHNGYGFPNEYRSCEPEGYNPISPCSTTIVRCQRGISELYECPNGKVYDRISTKCVDRDELDECSAFLTEIQEEIAAGEQTTQAVVTAEQRTNPYDNEYSCAERPDGVFSLGCQSQFLTCSGGVSRVMRCPADLIYNEFIGACEFAGNVLHCENEYSGGGSEYFSEDVCIGESSGEWWLEALPCSSLFFACRKGEKVLLGCPDNLVFSAETNRCEYQNDVAGCHESSGEVASGEISGDHSGDSNYSGDGSDPEENEHRTLTTDEASADLVQVPDSGSISSGDESYDYSGVSSGALPVESSGQIVEFSSGSGTAEASYGELSNTRIHRDEPIPDYYEYYNDHQGVAIDKVRKYRNPTSTPASPKLSSSTYGLNDDSILVNQNQKVEVSDLFAAGATDCTDKPDGFYGQGCSSLMVACSDGLPHPMTCPGDLKYDAEKQICDFPENVASCPHEKNSNADIDELLDAKTVLDAYFGGNSDARNKRSTPIDGIHKHNELATLLCKDHEDGRTSLGCEEGFLTCHSGRGYLMECKPGNTLDEELQKCVPLELHPTCFQSVKPREEVYQDHNSILDHESVKSSDVYESESEFKCVEDGYFAITICTPNYIHCLSGKAHDLMCDHGYFYSPSVQMCQTLEQMPECREVLGFSDSK